MSSMRGLETVCVSIPSLYQILVYFRFGIFSVVGLMFLSKVVVSFSKWTLTVQDGR